MEIKYPSVEDIMNANKKAVELLRATKAEKHELLASKQAIQKVLDSVKSSDGDVKKKAAMLLMEINRKHFFGSANKRTSFIVACDFLLANEGKIPLKRKEDVEFLMDVRAWKVTLEDVIRWLDE